MREDHVLSKKGCRITIRYGLVARIPGFHPGGSGSIPGTGIFLHRTKLCKRKTTELRYGLVARIPGSHPGGSGSIPGTGNLFLQFYSAEKSNVRK
ncbi:hypothetical protein DMN91_005139 [Ooceraea biroi]|uniref:Uncharacterized protein n=1 Tax=Ooceraea biroi TaxID=2015173 RepID=A0A3L8DR42_OOCBI|nr:hypothetical protein DMN91_005139 [Ooceraea biroi]